MTTKNESMLLIRGANRVADGDFGDFNRVFAHYRFRESVKRRIGQFGSAAFNTWRPQDRFEYWTKWVPMRFKGGSEHDTSSGGTSSGDEPRPRCARIPGARPETHTP
jgi:hypothetical protein